MPYTMLFTVIFLSIASGITYALDTFSPSLCFYPNSRCDTPTNVCFCCTDMDTNGCCTNNVLGGQNLSLQHSVNFFAAQNCARRQVGSCCPDSLESEECCSEEWGFGGYRLGLRENGVDGRALTECSMRLEKGDDGPLVSSESEREDSSSSSSGSSSGSDQGWFMAPSRRLRQGGGSARDGAHGNAAIGNGNGAGSRMQRNQARSTPFPPSPGANGNGNGAGHSRNGGQPAANGNGNAARPASNGNGNGAGPSNNGARPAANGNGPLNSNPPNGNTNRPGAVQPVPNAYSPLAVQAPPAGRPAPGSPTVPEVAPVCRNPDTVSYIDANGVRKDLKFQPERAIAVLRAIDRGNWEELEGLRVN